MYGQKAYFHIGTCPEMAAYTPFFELVPFALNGRENKYSDMIVSRQHNNARPVPGTPDDACNAYHICMALAWVLQQGRTTQGQWEKTRTWPG